jgi:hypothetical protein
MSSTENLWDEQLLWAKAGLYVEEAQKYERDSWLFSFWATLSLEMLARAALSHIHPVLLASSNDRDCMNLLYALNQTDKLASPLTPRSIDISEVFSRCEQLIPEFVKEHQKFCNGLLGMRNEELHSGGTPFNDLDVQKWLPRFYECCTVLLAALGKTLEDLVGKEEAQAGRKMIEAVNDQAAKEVVGEIKAFAKVWESKPEKERKAASALSESTARRSDGHVVKCPACESKALLQGEIISSLPPEIGDDAIITREVILPTLFICSACGLRVQGHNRLHAAGLSSTFTKTAVHDPIEYYGIEYGYSEADYNC